MQHLRLFLLAGGTATLLLAGCSGDPSAGTCGNGLLEVGEFCDDGNNDNGDGCASDCLIERPGEEPEEPEEMGPDAAPDEPDPVPTSALINEFVANPVNPAGLPDSAEYVELLGEPLTDLSSLTILALEGDLNGGPDQTKGAGTIHMIVQAGMTNEGGLYVTEVANHGIQNGSETIMVVRDFDGAAAVGDDLDANNDGVLDLDLDVVDAVAVHDGSEADLFYGGASVLPRDHMFTGVVDGASRINATDTDTADDWVPNMNRDLAMPQAGEALNTPGEPNAFTPESEE